jgi:uncharacterized protein (TIGR01777 family)
MKIFITGGTGFVGRRLAPALSHAGHEITILTRFGKDGPGGASLLTGDPTKEGDWQAEVQGHDVIINLAGASIFSRWTSETKRLIRESRLLTTRNLVAALGEGRGKHFFSTSAVGYYGFHGDEILTEDSPPGDDFLARLGRDWEEEARGAEKKGYRLVITRFGIILGEEGGALGQMVPLFKKYLGGPLGSGRQWFSWIHLEDLTRAFLFLLKNPEITGPVNCTSPHPVRNEDLAAAIGKVLGKPSSFRAPGFLLKMALGEFGSVLLEGQRVIPEKLHKSGFQFLYPEMEGALQQILTDRIS